MSFKSIETFIKNYIKEPILFPLKEIKKVFIGAIILTICYFFQFIMVLISTGLFQIYYSTQLTIILLFSILPFPILIYGYIGLIIKNNSLPYWKDIKSIISVGIKINIVIIIFMGILGFIMSILDYVSYYSFLDFWIYGTSTLLLPLYYPFVMLPIFEYLPLIIYITLLSNKIVATLYFLFLIVMPIVIFNILKKEKPTKNIKKYISIEYFAVLGLVFIYMLISLIPIYIYIHIGLIPFYLFDLKYLFFEYVKDFVIFYFLVVIGKVLGVYFNNTSISEVDTIA